MLVLKRIYTYIYEPTNDMICFEEEYEKEEATNAVALKCGNPYSTRAKSLEHQLMQQKTNRKLLIFACMSVCVCACVRAKRGAGNRKIIHFSNII